MVHDSEDSIFSVAHRKARDKIHCYLLKGEGVVGHRDVVCGSACLVGDNLVLLTDCTSFYIVSYPCIHSFPLVALLCPSYCFISSWVASRRVVVCPHHQRLLLFWGWWCIQLYRVNELFVWKYRDSLVVVLTLVCIWGTG
jgi:hypothetical protein